VEHAIPRASHCRSAPGRGCSGPATRSPIPARLGTCEPHRGLHLERRAPAAENSDGFRPLRAAPLRRPPAYVDGKTCFGRIGWARSAGVHRPRSVACGRCRAWKRDLGDTDATREPENGADPNLGSDSDSAGLGSNPSHPAKSHFLPNWPHFPPRGGPRRSWFRQRNQMVVGRWRPLRRPPMCSSKVRN
jgi:hypothetical protein